MPTVAIIMGETASGKSDLAVALARFVDGEIIGADSRQIYRDMEIGTAAPTPEQRAQAPHHLVSFLDPHERYSAARFVRDAIACIDEIHARGRHAVIVGGTGFYLRSLCGQMRLGQDHNIELRARLTREAEVHDPEWLYAWLQRLDPDRAQQLHPHDRYRVLRAIEMVLAARESRMSEIKSALEFQTLATRNIAWRKYWMQQPPEVLEARIALRVDGMLDRGLLDEAEHIGGQAVAASAVGYLHALGYLQGQATYAELRGQLIRATRQYAKRQRTWLRREPDVEILNGDLSSLRAIEHIVEACRWEKRGYAGF